ncbi:MAG: PAS domain-containing protein [Paracoccaceae bacterium]|nr:PAS domain-containing protein [Paracoccaceae bacterium]
MNIPKTSDLDDALIESLLENPQSSVRQLFNNEGLRAPELIWEPQPTELTSSLHRQFQKKCAELLDDTGRLRLGALDPAHFNGLADWLIFLEVEDGGADFKYISYGPAIIEAAGTDMAGRRASDQTGYTGAFFTSLYRAILASLRPVYSYHESPLELFTRGWHRLIMPVFDGADEIAQMLVMAVPDNELSVGLELLSDPVFVVDADGHVAYHNRAARTFFSLPKILHRGSLLAELTGMTLDIGATPEALLAKNRAITIPELAQHDGLMERLEITVSAAEHRGRVFYVIVMRLASA